MFLTEWRSFWFHLLLTLVLIGACGIVMRDQTNQTLPTITTTTTTVPIVEWDEENLNTLIETIANEEGFEHTYLLKGLAFYESRWMNHDKILDTNGYYSYGLLHYQLYTFLEQAELYKVIPEDTTLEQGRILIMNPKLQIRTICRMDLETIRQKWFNSWNKIYLCK